MAEAAERATQCQITVTLQENFGEEHSVEIRITPPDDDCISTCIAALKQRQHCWDDDGVSALDVTNMRHDITQVVSNARMTGQSWALLATPKECREFGKKGGFGCAVHLQAAANVLGQTIVVHNLREIGDDPVEPRVRYFTPTARKRDKTIKAVHLLKVGTDIARGQTRRIQPR